tara:strand:- start:320 stop:484 length:165 start_codon:yes stop_codon:yes gene_type:complete
MTDCTANEKLKRYLVLKQQSTFITSCKNFLRIYVVVFNEQGKNFTLLQELKENE